MEGSRKREESGTNRELGLAQWEVVSRGVLAQSPRVRGQV